MTLRYAAIGCGRVFERFHLPVLTAAPGVRVVAVYDADAGRAAEAATAAGGADVAGSVGELLAGGVDAVSVCTPNDAHVDHVLAAARAGAAVLCEKPLAHRADEARRLAAELPDDARVAVNLPYQLAGANALVASLLAGGCESARFELTTPGARLWRPRSDWYGDPARAGGGALLDLGVHVVALLRTLFGTDGEVVACALRGGPPEDAATLTLRYGGTPVEVAIDRRSPRVRMVLDARTQAGDVSYDVRTGLVTLPDGTAREAGGLVETAAVAAFVAGDRAPGVATALAAEETVWAAYALAGA